MRMSFAEMVCLIAVNWMIVFARFLDRGTVFILSMVCEDGLLVGKLGSIRVRT